MSYLARKQEQYEQDAFFAERDDDEGGAVGSIHSVFKLQRLKSKLEYILRTIRSLPSIMISFVKKLIQILSSPHEFYLFVCDIWDRLRNTPVYVFYSYLWKTRKTHFFMNVFVSYLLPMILEALPWYFSRRKIGQKLRAGRNTIQNRMIAGEQLTASLAYNYVALTVLYSLLENLDRHLNHRVQLVNRLLVKRLVLERILYSEIWAFNEYQGRELEYRISTEIQTTLRLFSTIIPKLFSSIYAVYQESKDLYHNRHNIDLLSIGLPLFSMVVWKCVDWIKVQIMGRRRSTSVVAIPQVSELFNNVMDGLVDIQLNNIQQKELKYYDKIISEQFSGWEDLRMFGNRVYDTFTKRGVFEFLSEVYVAAMVMRKKGMNFEQYRKIQIDIDHLVKLLKRTGNYLVQTKRSIERQNRVVELMRLPNFVDEHRYLPIKVSNFDKLVIEDIVFSYSKEKKPPYALNFNGSIIFEAKKIYAIIGENRSGKSTLVNLLTKLYTPKSGKITFNGVEYDLIDRNSLRYIITYVAQKPYIFPGTVMENIRIGKPDATDNEIIRAAKLAGLFLYEEKVATERRKKKTTTQSCITTVEVASEESSEEQPSSQEKKKITRKRALKILNQSVQARGANISGGFAQSIALARAFLRKDARIVILDESMSAMDPIKKRQIIMPNLMSFVRENDITLIMISHDMSCITQVDHIIMLETGKITCQGSHDQLVEMNEQKYLQMIGLSPNL
jgi:ATP-binding cassette subfamily B multidrug efflux pump